MAPLASLPGIAPLLACSALLAAWELPARAIGIDGLPPPAQAPARGARRPGDAPEHRPLAPPHGRVPPPAALGGTPHQPHPATQPAAGGVLQSAADGDLSGAQGRADAHHHALARRRRRLEDAGDLPRCQPPGRLPQLSREPRGRGENPVVRRRNGNGSADAARAHRAAGGIAGNPGRLPDRARARAHHHGHERDDRAADRHRKHPVQLSRHGAVRHRLRHDRDHRRARLHARLGIRERARPAGGLGGAGARYRRGDHVTGRATPLADMLVGLVPIALIVGLWELLASPGVGPPSLLPAPGGVVARLVEQLGSPTYLGHAATTLFRLFAGFGIAVVIGVALGMAAMGWRAAEAGVMPLVRVLAPVPKIALYPAFILTLGFENASKIALVVADAAFPILLATYQGASAVEPKLAWAAQAVGVSRWRCLFTVVLPAALPSVLTGCRIALVISCIVVFLAEMITSTDGLGHLLVRAARNFQTVDMFVPLITISLLGLGLNASFNALRRRLLIGFPEEK